MDVCNFIEEVINNNPIIVVGSGSSRGAGISGMKELGQYLKENITPESDNDQREWNEILKQIENGKGLEESLQSSNLTECLTYSIVEATWSCISRDEKQALLKIASGDDICGFIRYFERYKHTSNYVINVITTNYDQIIEWSAAYAGLQIWDGFDNGVLSKPLSLAEYERKMTKFINGKLRKINYVRIYKPHGSLSWFKTRNGEFVKLQGVNHFDKDLLKEIGLTPVIVTPGTGKYLETHRDPYNQIFAEMNRCIQEAKGMVFYGFGFNDDHIQGSFQSVMLNIHIPKLIITKELSSSFYKIMENGEIKNFVAIEEYGLNSKVYSDCISEEFIEGNRWSFASLLNLAWGEEYAVHS
ncbi:hypothetical protein GGQ77_002572 [Geobacillus thermodenitrificans]|uniref:SIR2 family protein n=1 Tax=Geobacillus thermodenitrificans TaxID=33940 RepID=UPI001243128D|nr:SIR2 family protein [Geobacillus thermodenitrificans]MEC5188802.1 hypothetical protein [Geobacillus thermodenitrificans]